MKLIEIITCIEEIAPPAFAASWDNCGMQVARIQEDVTTLAVCLDPTPCAIEKAIQIGAQCIISHHPLLMQGRLPSKIDAYHHVLRLLLTHDVALYSAHTSLDVQAKGPVGWLARALELVDVDVLEPVGDVSLGIGYGLVGNCAKPVSLSMLLEKLGTHIDLRTATLCGDVPETLSRIAYCPGSGTSFMQAAHAQGADIFITGDVKYHSALETPLGILDVGHHSLEEVMMQQLANVLQTHVASLRIEFISSMSPLRPACS